MVNGFLLKVRIDNKSTESKMAKHQPAPDLPALQTVNCTLRLIEVFLH